MENNENNQQKPNNKTKGQSGQDAAQAGTNIGSDLSKELDEKIAEIEYKSVEESTKEFAAKLGLPYLNLRGYPVDAKALLLIDEITAHKARIALIARDKNKLTAAVSDPSLKSTKEILEKLKSGGFEANIVLVSSNSLAEAWKRYALAVTKTPLSTESVKIQQKALEAAQKQIKTLRDLKDKVAKIPVTELLTLLIAGALKLGASDIHLEPEPDKIRLRYRLDGVLVDIVNFSKINYDKLLSRIKLHSGIKINIHNVPQDGRFNISLENKNVEVRVSSLPGPDGESIVMRILDPTTIRRDIEKLGIREDLLEQIKRLLEKTTGAILTTGPTGSGKTTTLYAFIKHINRPEIKIITLEDPIEYKIGGITQTQVDNSAGYTFSAGLRSIVRQDPDVILVGEIRDYETAEMAAQAALTGHLVLSTIHTNDASGTVPRLIDLGLKPVTIAPALNAAMAQRLVRRLCENCKKEENAKPDDLKLLKQYLSNIPERVKMPKIEEGMKIFYPVGCPLCNSTGYKGRVGVYELFEVDSEMERLIIKSPVPSSIKELAVKKGMLTLLQDGLIKAAQGITSIEEVLRVIGK